MYFVPNKNYLFVYLVLGLGSTYRHLLDFKFDEPFEVIDIEVVNLRSTEEDLVPFVGAINKRKKGRIFLDQKQEEWYHTEPEEYTLRDKRLAAASVWNPYTTSHPQMGKIGHVFMLEYGMCLTHLLELSSGVDDSNKPKILDICLRLMEEHADKLLLNT